MRTWAGISRPQQTARAKKHKQTETTTETDPLLVSKGLDDVLAMVGDCCICLGWSHSNQTANPICAKTLHARGIDFPLLPQLPQGEGLSKNTPSCSFAILFRCGLRSYIGSLNRGKSGSGMRAICCLLAQQASWSFRVHPFIIRFTRLCAVC